MYAFSGQESWNDLFEKMLHNKMLHWEDHIKGRLAQLGERHVRNEFLTFLQIGFLQRFQHNYFISQAKFYSAISVYSVQLLGIR